MAKQKPYRITAYILVACVLVAVLGIVAMQLAGSKVILENQQLTDRLSQLEQENLEWAERIADLGSDGSIEQLARERLHWVHDQEIVYIDTGY